jgi:hypothetical protein
MKGIKVCSRHESSPVKQTCNAQDNYTSRYLANLNYRTVSDKHPLNPGYAVSANLLTNTETDFITVGALSETLEFVANCRGNVPNGHISLKC